MYREEGVTGANKGIGYDYATIKYVSTGIKEQHEIDVEPQYRGPTVFTGALRLPENRKCRVFDISGRSVDPDNIQPGIYVISIDDETMYKEAKLK